MPYTLAAINTLTNPLKNIASDKEHWYAQNYDPPVDLLEPSTNTSTFKDIKLFSNFNMGHVYMLSPEISSTSIIENAFAPFFINSKPSNTLLFFKEENLPEDTTSLHQIKHTIFKGSIEEKFDTAFNKLGQFAKLKENWDSYASNAIDKNCISRAIDILKYLISLQDQFNFETPLPFVAPLSNGGIQFEWEDENKYLELSCLPKSSEIDFFASGRTSAGEINLEGATKPLSNIIKLLRWFASGHAEDLGHISFEIFL